MHKIMVDKIIVDEMMDEMMVESFVRDDAGDSSRRRLLYICAAALA